jgi:hypothetical protein
MVGLRTCQHPVVELPLSYPHRFNSRENIPWFPVNGILRVSHLTLLVALEKKEILYPSLNSNQCSSVVQSGEQFISFGATALQWAMASSFTMFLDHTKRHTTVGRNPLDGWSARRGDLYLTTHNTLNRQTYMPPVGFEPTISAGERPQIYDLDRAATGTSVAKLLSAIEPSTLR